MGKTKFMVGCKGVEYVEESGNWACGVCGSGVASNSVQCTKCSKWMHKRCSEVRGSLFSARNAFDCKNCTGEITKHIKRDSMGLNIGGSEMLKKVNKFCYLGDMINSNGGAEAAVTARMRCAWRKFRELALKGFSLRLKGRVYEKLREKLHGI